jgi:hypothetical protein
MTTADEKFFAWLDGELAPDEAAKVEAEVAANSDLAQLAKQHRAMQAQLKGAFDSILDAPVPENLQRPAHRKEAQVVDFAAAKRARDQRNWGSPAQWLAMAATLVIGVFVGTAMPQRNSAPLEVRDGRIYAASVLNTALDEQLASAPAGEVRIGMTFRDHSGAICRTFTDPQASGLACKDKQRWQLRGLFAAPEGQGSSYRMAGGMDPNLAALVDSTMAGEPFDSGEEKAAKLRHWN